MTFLLTISSNLLCLEQKQMQPPYFSWLQQLPVVIDVGHKVDLGVKVLLLVDHAHVVQAQVS